MRSLLLSVVPALALSVLSSPAQAHEDVLPRLSWQLRAVEQINARRPYGPFREAIEHQVELIRVRLGQFYTRPWERQAELSAIDESLYAILQYDQNGRDEGPWLSAQTDQTVSRMRRLVQEAQSEYAGVAYGGYGNYGSYGGTPLAVPPPYAGGYVPAPAPVTPPCYR